MLQQNIKNHICKHQLAWILTELLDEAEIVDLEVQCDIHDAPTPTASLSVNGVVGNLADAFFLQENAQRVVHECLVQKTERAIRRIGYMDVQEIQTFMGNCAHLVEGGDFTEIVWALLIDSRLDVQQHGQKLLNQYERSVDEIANFCSLTRTERGAEVDEIHQTVQAPPDEPTQIPTAVAIPDPETEEKLLELQQAVDQLNDDSAALKAENETLKEELQRSVQENEDFRDKEHRFMEQDIHIQQLQLKIHNLTRQVEKMSNQSTRVNAVHKAAQTEYAVGLKAFDEFVYTSNQTFEQMQTDFQSHTAELKKFSEISQTALQHARDKVEQLFSQHESRQNLQNRVLDGQPSVGVFVDVQNMFYAAKDRYAGRVDYIKLLDLIVGPRELVVAYAYVVQIPEINQSGFLSLLEHNGYTIKSKDLRLRGDGTAKGDWDVGIAIDIVSMLEALDVVILASGDGDFCALAELIKQQGKRVEVVAFEHNTSMDLQRMADQFYPIGDELLI